MGPWHRNLRFSWLAFFLRDIISCMISTVASFRATKATILVVSGNLLTCMVMNIICRRQLIPSWNSEAIRPCLSMAFWNECIEWGWNSSWHHSVAAENIRLAPNTYTAWVRTWSKLFSCKSVLTVRSYRIYVVGEVFPWGGNSVIFSVCASISRTGVQLHEIDIWLDPRSLDEFYGALMFPKINVRVT